MGIKTWIGILGVFYIRHCLFAGQREFYFQVMVKEVFSSIWKIRKNIRNEIFKVGLQVALVVVCTKELPKKYEYRNRSLGQFKSKCIPLASMR